MNSLTPAEIEALLAALPSLPLGEQESLLAEIEELERLNHLQACRDDFLTFCKHVYPDFKEGPHHRHMKPMLHGVKDGTELRVTISMAPRFGKSYSISYLFVAWYLGHNPTHHIIMVTHTASLSADFGRNIRNMIDSAVYKELFPDTVVSRDKSAADNWTTTLAGKYLAIGIGANVAGHGAHLLIADDLVSEKAIMEGNPENTFAAAWQYMQVGPLQRLMPGGRIIMIGCMTAETGVLMADGTEKEIQHIKVGDRVATYDDGKITTSRVTNWIKHHPDFVYKIRTTSGTIVRANKRHPFLVDRNGSRSWVRVRDLKVGDCLVGVVQPQDVSDLTKPRGCVAPATSESCALTGALEPKVGTATGGSGEALNVLPRAATAQHLQKGFAVAATERNHGVLESTASLLSKSAKAISSLGMVFLRKFMTLRSQNKAGFVQSASSRQQEKTQGPGKSQNSTSITATTPTKFEGFCATTAILQSAGEKHQKYSTPQPSTYDTTPDAIVEIVEDGFEAVFDMEIERTENFIANGVVSHNTRWGKKDPIGRALAWAENNPDSLPWNEVRFPAIMPSGLSLWPEQWPLEELLAKKAGMAPQFWAAQYMQEPTSEEGALIKREWWRIWPTDTPPKVEYMISSWDTAHEAKTSADYTACVLWGVWFNEDMQQNQLIMLDAFKGRWEFPQLKKLALEHYKDRSPDTMLVEKKAAGAPLLQELRAMGIPVSEFTPSRGNDKRARVNAVSDLFFSGCVWAPDMRWAHEVIQEVSDFPNGEHDDWVDCVTQAVLRYRSGGFIRLPSDEQYEQVARRRHVEYY